MHLALPAVEELPQRGVFQCPQHGGKTNIGLQPDPRVRIQITCLGAQILDGNGLGVKNSDRFDSG